MKHNLFFVIFYGFVWKLGILSKFFVMPTASRERNKVGELAHIHIMKANAYLKMNESNRIFHNYKINICLVFSNLEKREVDISYRFFKYFFNHVNIKIQ